MTESGFSAFLAYLQERKDTENPKPAKLIAEKELRQKSTTQPTIPLPTMPVNARPPAVPVTVPYMPPPERMEDYTGSFCLLHRLTANFPSYHEILVSIEDYSFLTVFVWKLVFVDSGKSVRVTNKQMQYLHRALLNAPPNLLVDHKNHRPLDNRRTNLRLCTQSQNNSNTHRKTNGTSRFRGVEFYRGKWKVQAGGGKRKRVFLGHFATEIEAAHAYNEYAKREYGEFACLNPV